jgi:transposase, IS30 family
MTVDKGKGFAQFAHHRQITQLLGINVYFAHPYSSWECGLSENSNGLIRWYIKKDSSFEYITR